MDKQKVFLLYNKLKKEYPGKYVFLNFENPWQLLVATILSSQCTDKLVNRVTAQLFVKYHSIENFAEVNLKELTYDLSSINFYITKAKNIQNSAKIILANYQGKVPSSFEDLMKLPGVGRKTANVVRGNAFGLPAITVDTHVKRLSYRIGFTKEQNPLKIEKQLLLLWHDLDMLDFSHLLILHGRNICKAQKVLCDACVIKKVCAQNGI